jgi:hypothetical protein
MSFQLRPLAAQSGETGPTGTDTAAVGVGASNTTVEAAPTPAPEPLSAAPTDETVAFQVKQLASEHFWRQGIALS